MMSLANGTDLIVFSSDKFGFEGIRTSALMKEFSKKKKVYFIEAPIMDVAREPTYFLKKEEDEVCIIQPYLPAETSIFEQKKSLLKIVKDVIHDEQVSHYTMWTDTPKAMYFIRNLTPEIIIYDCVNNYGSTNAELEKELFQYADVVLTSAMTNNIPGTIQGREMNLPSLSVCSAY